MERENTKDEGRLGLLLFSLGTLWSGEEGGYLFSDSTSSSDNGSTSSDSNCMDSFDYPL